MNNIISAVLWFVALGGVFGILLAIASKLFHVEHDERIDAVQECLPGANCGGCGFAGCGQLAEKIVAGEAVASDCLACSQDSAEKIAAIMGTEAAAVVRKRAHVVCSGVNCVTKKKYIYEGEHDCIAAMRLAGGDKLCEFACIGLGTCVDACKFDAISLKDGVAQVDYSKCTGCGVCASVCPKRVISIIPFEAPYSVDCNSEDKGIVTKNSCEAGCIGCKLCEKVCDSGAISVKNNLAFIDYDKCTGCGACAEKCPRKIIKKSGIVMIRRDEYINDEHEALVSDASEDGEIDNDEDDESGMLID